MFIHDLCVLCLYIKAFSKNGNKVIKPLNDEHESLVGDQSAISFYDSYTVNQLYRCSGMYGQTYVGRPYRLVKVGFTRCSTDGK